jgi:WD40 repeat protein
MYNISSILISTTKGGTLLIDYSSNDCKINKINFGKKRDNNYMDSSEYDFDEESFNPFPKVICNKFINSDDKNLKFVSSTTNGDLLLYDVNSGYTDIIIKNYDSPVYTFDILNEVIFMGEESGRIEVLDIRESHANNKNIYYLYSHPGKNEVCKTVYSKNNNYVLSGGNDNNAIIFDFRNYKILKSISHKGAIKGLSINTNENYLVTGGGNKDKMIKLLDLKKVKQISETKANSQITALEFINNSTIFTSFGYNENMSAVYNLDYDELDKENCSVMQLCNISLSNSVQSELNDMKDIFNKQDEFERHYKRILYTSVDKNNQYVANASEGELKIFKIEKYSKSKFDLGLDDCFIFH